MINYTLKHLYAKFLTTHSLNVNSQSCTSESLKLLYFDMIDV